MDTCQGRQQVSASFALVVTVPCSYSVVPEVRALPVHLWQSAYLDLCDLTCDLLGEKARMFAAKRVGRLACCSMHAICTQTTDGWQVVSLVARDQLCQSVVLQTRSGATDFEYIWPKLATVSEAQSPPASQPILNQSINQSNYLCVLDACARALCQHV